MLQAIYIKLWTGLVWSNGRMIVWSGVLGSSVIRSGVVRSYGPITRTYSMPLNPPFEAKGNVGKVSNISQ